MKYVITLITLFIITGTSINADTNCDNLITTCDNVITAQDKSIQDLKKANKQLEDALVDSQKGPLVPMWVVVVGSIVGGMLLSAQVRK